MEDTLVNMEKKNPEKSGTIQEGRDEKGRFIPGISGNPEGKPPGTKNFSTDFDEAVEDIAIEENITKSEARKMLLKKAYYEAKGGNFNFYKDIIDRDYGKVKENVDVGVSDELKTLFEKLNKIVDAKD